MSQSPEKSGWKNKISNVQSTSKLDSDILGNVLTSAKFWYTILTRLITTGYLGYQAMQNQAKLHKFDRGDANMWYGFTACAFAFGSFFAWLSLTIAKSPEKKALSKILLLVDGMAFFTYLLSAFRLSPTLRDINGYPVELARFMEWICTCPSLILMVGDITKMRTTASRTSKFDYVLLVCGFMASITKEPYSTYFAFGAVTCFVQVITGLDDMFKAAVNDPTCKLDSYSLQIARFATVITWIAFPATWFSTKYRILSYSQGEICYCIADIGAKVFLTLVLVNSSVEQSQNERVDEMTGIATAMEQQLSNSDALLEKMMPKEVLEQLKTGKAPNAEQYDSVTVFFSDITNFTVISSQTSTQQMLATLNKLWNQYDAIAKKWGMYKVETIGDAYLGVMGCPERRPDHAIRSVEFAIDIMEMIQSFRTDMDTQIQIRIGLNSGSITAGVLGEMNPHWCIVGDTVNTASRMESTSKPMKIHISESTYDLAKKGNFRFEGPDILQIKVLRF
jgi:class 3 adenylate cyclase